MPILRNDQLYQTMALQLRKTEAAAAMDAETPKPVAAKKQMPAADAALSSMEVDAAPRYWPTNLYQ